MRTLSICLGDFETASACDLAEAGAWRYAEDPTTEIICFCFAQELNETPMVWTPADGRDSEVGRALLALVLDPDVIFIAHNCQFEKAIWRRIMVEQLGWPDIPNSRWHDTMAVCAMKVLPQKLDRAAVVLRLSQEKDLEGSRLTKALSRPNKKTGMYDRSEGTLKRVYQYCQQDIRSEFELHRRVGWLTPGERKVWLLDQRINERGVKLDQDFIRQARLIVDRATIPLAQEFRQITGVNFSQGAKILEWLKGEGVHLPNMQKQTLADILGEHDDDEDPEDFLRAEVQDLPDHVRRALHIRQLVGSASVKKLGRMEASVGSNGRTRGVLQYHGAGPGRWSGRVFQPQNFPRGTLKLGENPVPVDMVVEAIMTGDPAYVEMLIGPAVETVVGGLRHALIPESDRLYCSGDYAQVECRVLLALAGQHDKTALLASGASPYLDMAKLIFPGRTIDKHADVNEYTLAKNSVLGLGFQMGAPKFMDRYGQGQELPFFKELVRVYREDWAPMVPKLWYGLERAATRTVWDGTPHEAFGVLYQLEDGWLTARLPSGRKLWYFNPRPVKKAMPWDPNDIRSAFTYQAQKQGKWITVDAFGGQLTENVVQALARDLLCNAMFIAEDNDFPISLTVHDEILAEPLLAKADHRVLEEIMADMPDWARAIQVPIKAEGWTGDRYRK